METKKQNNLIKNFYVKFIVFALIVNVAYFIFSLNEIKYTIKKIDLSDVTVTIADKESILLNEIDRYKMLVSYIKKAPEFQDFIRDPLKNKSDFEYEVLKHLPEYEAISQFRYIDKYGMERVRIDKNDLSGVFSIIKTQDLQDKSSSDYFVNAKEKTLNTIYLSKLDLNIEHGKLEIPFNPMLQIIMPLESNGAFNGILIMNLKMSSILQQNFYFPMYDYRVINEDGEILLSSFENESWGSYQKQKITIKDIFPNEYQSIINNPYYEGENFRSLHLNRINTQKRLITILSIKSDYLDEMYEELLLDSYINIVFILLFSLFIAYFLAQGLQDLFKQFIKQEKHVFALGKYKDMLQEQVKEQTIELEQAKEKALKESKTKSIFLATMSHEIRTPLNAILGFVDLAKDKNISNDIRAEYIDIIDTNTYALLDIINTILDISKIESGEFILEHRPFEIFKIYQQVMTLFDAKAKEKNIEFTYSIDNALTNKTLIGDSTKLRQVLSNLISNAVKFTPENGKIKSKLELLDKSADEIRLQYSVQDSGIGIAKDKLKTIFEPFVQEYASTSREYGGTGLGLNIAKEIIEKMGGEISVESKKKIGSIFTFIITLPLGEAIREKEENQDYEKYKYKGSVLVADDAPINQKLIKILLQNHGLDVLLANDGIEAVEIFQDNHNTIDMILMDINMPRLDGIKAMQQIKDMQKTLHKNIPVIAFSANAIVGDREKYLNLGFDAYLTKPIEQDKLFAYMDQYTQKVALSEKESDDVINSKDMLSSLAQNLGISLELYKEFLEEYLETLQEDLTLLVDAVKNQRDEDIKKIAHKLKGISGNMGFEKLFELFRSFEETQSDFVQLLQQIKKEITMIENLIK